MQHRVKLSQAKALVARMRHSASVEQLEEAWVQYLHTLEQSWHKLEAFYKSYPQWGNWSSVYREERSRPGSLPGYLRAARGADEHSLEGITEREPGGIGINPAHGNVLHIESMQVQNGVITEFRSPQPVVFHFIPGRMCPKPIVNRGTLYEVPSSYAGEPIDTSSALAVAEAGVLYYDTVFTRAENYFGSRQSRSG